MKYCLSDNLSPTILTLADEIKVQYKDRRGIPDLATKYPTATIILQLLPSQITDEINWTEIENYKILCRDQFICCIGTIAERNECMRRDIKFYLGYPIDTFAELRALKDIGASYANVGVGLFFDLPAAAAIGLPLRAVPNVANYDPTLYSSGVCGQWIRPEDVELYSPYIQTLQFEDADPTKETALYRIYTKDGWSGDLSNLITNLNYSVTSRLIPEDVIKSRLTCQHRCQRTGSCNLCYHAFSFANVDKLREYAIKNNLL